MQHRQKSIELPWWLVEHGDHCGHCSQSFPDDSAYHCHACDTAVCADCAVVSNVTRAAHCPSCAAAEQDF